ncbi:MAG: transcriptional repressor NrdR [Chloroflexi bacterium]|nr:transcriptional repressor NrdR [Chloroflexota bacterium]MBM4451582.1 transcriptional repressor NrdR [Chloroflexota bacterium]MBM4453726.1 transcriptional repressor NrdR [Chloroflexota bacterium]
MKCPSCGEPESKVIDSRSVGDGIRRRRECVVCKSRFTTYERLQSTNLLIIKKDGRREEFNRDKLLTGIRKACEKRPLPIGAIEKLVDNIEIELYRLGKAEIPSSIVGDMVIERLQELDHIAHIRFASVYREFADLATLKQEVDMLVESKSRIPPRGQLRLISQEESSYPNRRGRRRNR